MTDHDRQVVLAMGKHGGSFASALAEAAWRADAVNLQTIKETWPGLWAQYAEVAALKAKQEEAQP